MLPKRTKLERCTITSSFDDCPTRYFFLARSPLISVLVHRNSSSGQFLKIVILIVRTSTSIPHVLKFKLLSFFCNGKHNRPLMVIACKISTIIEIKRPFHPQIIACKRKNWSRYLYLRLASPFEFAHARKYIASSFRNWTRNLRVYTHTHTRVDSRGMNGRVGDAESGIHRGLAIS